MIICSWGYKISSMVDYGDVSNHVSSLVTQVNYKRIQLGDEEKTLKDMQWLEMIINGADPLARFVSTQNHVIRPKLKLNPKSHPKFVGLSMMFCGKNYSNLQSPLSNL